MSLHDAIPSLKNNHTKKEVDRANFGTLWRSSNIAMAYSIFGKHVKSAILQSIKQASKYA